MEGVYILIELEIQRTTTVNSKPRVKVVGVGTYPECVRLRQLREQLHERQSKKINRSNIDITYLLSNAYSATDSIQQLEERVRAV